MTSKSYPKIISHLIIMVTFKFYKGKYPKKYKVEVYRSSKKIKTTQFGDQRYGQYQDKTPLKLYMCDTHATPQARVGLQWGRSDQYRRAV